MKKAFTLIELLIVVAIIAILAAIAVPNFLEAQTRAKVARILSDQRTYATALETYMIDNSSYPTHWPYTTTGGVQIPAGYVTSSINFEISKRQDPVPSPNPYATGNDGLPSFGYKDGTNGAPISLTTPVSYLNTYVPDTFAEMKQATFSYVSGPAGFLLWSPGPDVTDALGKSHNAEAIIRGGDSLPSQYLIAGPAGTVASKGPTGSSNTTDSFTYDATNGTASTGDVYRTK